MDWSEVVPETERLDTSAHRAKGQLAQKAKRQPPSRSKLKESLSSPGERAQVSWTWAEASSRLDDYHLFDGGFLSFRMVMEVNRSVLKLLRLAGDQSMRVCPCRWPYPPLSVRQKKVWCLLWPAVASRCRRMHRAPPPRRPKTPPPPASFGM